MIPFSHLYLLRATKTSNCNYFRLVKPVVIPQGSGAADGSVRLWQVKRGLGNNKTLEAIGAFPAPGYVNALAIASSGRFVLAGLGQEPRLGRWGRESGTRSGLLLQPLLLKDE